MSYSGAEDKRQEYDLALNLVQSTPSFHSDPTVQAIMTLLHLRSGDLPSARSVTEGKQSSDSDEVIKKVKIIELGLMGEWQRAKDFITEHTKTDDHAVRSKCSPYHIYLLNSIKQWQNDLAVVNLYLGNLETVCTLNLPLAPDFCQNLNIGDKGHRFTLIETNRRSL